MVQGQSKRQGHTSIRLPLAAKTSWCVLVVVGFTYSPVNPLFFLAGLGVIVSIKRVVGRGCSSSDPLVLCGSPDFRLMSRRVAWKKSLALDYWVLCHSLGSCGSATPRLSIQSGSGEVGETCPCFVFHTPIHEKVAEPLPQSRESAVRFFAHG